MEKTFFQHIRFQSKAALTIAVRYNGDGTATAGFAFCSPGDNFSRSKGRKLAEGRMVSTVFSWLFPGVMGTGQNVLLAAARDILAKNYLDAWPCREWAEEAYSEFVSKNRPEIALEEYSSQDDAFESALLAEDASESESESEYEDNKNLAKMCYIFYDMGTPDLDAVNAIGSTFAFSAAEARDAWYSYKAEMEGPVA